MNGIALEDQLTKSIMVFNWFGDECFELSNLAGMSFVWFDRPDESSPKKDCCW